MKDKSALKVIDRILEAAIIILFTIMFVVTTANVVMRYIFNSPISFSVELGRYTFISIVYLGSIFVMREDGHIGLDIIVDALPGVLGTIVKKISRILVLCYLAVFFVMSSRMVMGNWNSRSSSMRIPMSVVYLVMVIGSLGMFLEELRLLFGKEEKEEKEGGEDPENMGGGM